MIEDIGYYYFLEDYQRVIEIHHENDYEVFNEPEYYYYLGSSYLEIGYELKAIDCFNIILSYSDNEFTDLAIFGLTFSYYELRKEEVAVEQFLKIQIQNLIYIADYSIDELLPENINQAISIVERIIRNNFFYDREKDYSSLIEKAQIQSILLESLLHLKNEDYLHAEKVLSKLLEKDNITQEIEFINDSYFYGLLYIVYIQQILISNDKKLQNYIFSIKSRFIKYLCNSNIFYSSLFKSLISHLFDNNYYRFINDIYEKLNISPNYLPNDTLFMFAYSANIINKKEVAKFIYEKEIEISGGSSNTFNNLGNLYKEEKNYLVAKDLFYKSIELDKTNINPYINLANLLIDDKKYLDALPYLRDGFLLDSENSRILSSFNKLPLLFFPVFPNKHLTEKEHNELNELYWDSNISVKEIKECFNISNNKKDYFSPLIYFYEACPNCNCNLGYKNRSAWKEKRIECLSCEHQHNMNWCYCSKCKKEREENIRKEREIEHKRKESELKEKIEKASTNEYIKWAISKLNYKEKIFAKSLSELIREKKSTTWIDVCNKANIVSHEKYVKRLLDLSLIFIGLDDKYIFNSALQPEMIELKNIRNITKSLRFEILQRDHHTCQYCGRKAPEVELEIDHILPVSKGGNDDFDNLITSCRDCNSGKTNKIINKNTVNEEWKDTIRKKREELLIQKREKIEEVKIFWASCRKGYLTTYDEKFINNFIEKYDPSWIKKAIKISCERNATDYAKYTSGILKRWSQEGFPDDIANLKLTQKLATEAQINYVRALLINHDLTLEECCGKEDLNELTMLDAKNIIEELKDK